MTVPTAIDHVATDEGHHLIHDSHGRPRGDVSEGPGDHARGEKFVPVPHRVGMNGELLLFDMDVVDGRTELERFGASAPIFRTASGPEVITVVDEPLAGWRAPLLPGLGVGEGRPYAPAGTCDLRTQSNGVGRGIH